MERKGRTMDKKPDDKHTSKYTVNHMFPIGKAEPNPIHIFNEEGKSIAGFDFEITLDQAKLFEEVFDVNRELLDICKGLLSQYKDEFGNTPCFCGSDEYRVHVECVYCKAEQAISKAEGK